MERDARRKVVAYLVLTLLLAAPFYYLILSAGSLGVRGGIYVLGVMWAPGLAAIITRAVHQRDLRGVGWGWGQSRYQLASYLIPVAAGTIVYSLAWALGIAGFDPGGLAGDSGRGTLEVIALAATVGVLQSAIPALGEEIGWRGLLVPELAKAFSYTKVSIFCAVVWSVYHFPALLFADYTSDAPRWYALVMFTVGITGASFMATWLRLKSGSVWTGVLLHASHNLFIQGVFDGLTNNRMYTEFITTEFGVGLAVVYAGGAYWCWRNRGSLPTSMSATTDHGLARDEA
ncbi:MAG: CPBP family intramembrane glutamic endopeptidase [Longimicrobiales bacterium]